MSRSVQNYHQYQQIKPLEETIKLAKNEVKETEETNLGFKATKDIGKAIKNSNNLIIYGYIRSLFR